jgi:glycosyltransferase involved in cell wall biosynthesis
MSNLIDRPVVSVVIPAFNRVEPLKLALRSAALAAAGLPTEIILVDDGSQPPLREVVGPTPAPVVHLGQPNQGSIVARMTGLAAARGEFVLFFDSDDLVHPDKYVLQVEAMRDAGADISYSDMANYRLDAEGEPVFAAGDELGRVENSLNFFLRLQPPVHSPMYRREYLTSHLNEPLIPARRQYDPVGDVWLYYNLLPFPARIVKVDAPLTALGQHEENRYSNNWEKLGLAALRLMEDFHAACPRTPETLAARVAVGETAFHSWRRLPKDFHPAFAERMITLWRQSPRGPLARLGEGRFQWLAHLFGAERAAGVLRRWRGHSYDSCRTLSDEEFVGLLSEL